MITTKVSCRRISKKLLYIKLVIYLSRHDPFCGRVYTTPFNIFKATTGKLAKVCFSRNISLDTKIAWKVYELYSICQQWRFSKIWWMCWTKRVTNQTKVGVGMVERNQRWPLFMQCGIRFGINCVANTNTGLIFLKCFLYTIELMTLATREWKEQI